MQPTSAGKILISDNDLVETNNRELETMDAINLLVSATSSNRDIYSKILGTVVSLM